MGLQNKGSVVAIRQGGDAEREQGSGSVQGARINILLLFVLGGMGHHHHGYTVYHRAVQLNPEGPHHSSTTGEEREERGREREVGDFGIQKERKANIEMSPQTETGGT